MLFKQHHGISIFQSTLPYGSDVTSLLQVQDYCYFNPRSLTGATIKTLMLMVILIFQSTLPYGSDGQWSLPYDACSNFNPRSLTGATFRCSPYH